MNSLTASSTPSGIVSLNLTVNPFLFSLTFFVSTGVPETGSDEDRSVFTGFSIRIVFISRFEAGARSTFLISGSFGLGFEPEATALGPKNDISTAAFAAGPGGFGGGLTTGLGGAMPRANAASLEGPCKAAGFTSGSCLTSSVLRFFAATNQFNLHNDSRSGSSGNISTSRLFFSSTSTMYVL